MINRLICLAVVAALGAHGAEIQVQRFEKELPEGNYNVTVKFGDAKRASDTWVKAESRRLMLENVVTKPGEFVTRTITVNIRTPKIADGRTVGLKGNEGDMARWDNKLSLEFLGNQPAAVVENIAPAPDAMTVYLAGDSTVTEQGGEPWAGWGQMLSVFFQPGVAVANHAQSGLSLSSFKGQRRLDKILSTLKPGDYLFIQFGHNDQKEKGEGVGPFTTYKSRLKDYVAVTRQHGGIPVLVTPMERRRFDADGKAFATLSDYAEAVRQVGQEEKVPVIDLNAMSLKLYQALGPEPSKRAFVYYPSGTFPGQKEELKDNTHHSVYGGYELAKCVVEGIKANVPALAKRLRDLPAFDPAKPDAFESVHIPASQAVSTEKPAGS